MATTWTDQNLPLVPFPSVPLLPDGQAFEGALVRTPDGMAFIANAQQLQSQLNPITSAAKPNVTLSPVGTGTVGVQMQLAATADSSTSTIVKVEFFAGTELVGSDPASPYGATYTPTGVGTVYFTAKATDALGVSTVTKAQPVVINAKGTTTNLPPVVTVDATPKSVVLGSGVTITATATDPDGSVSGVDYYDGATRLGGSTAAPYVQTFVPTTVGQHILTAIATDNQGVSTTKTVTITVTAAPVTTTKPDKPSYLFDDDADTLQFNSPLGSSELLLSTNNGSFVADPGKITVGNVNRPEGYYKSKVKAATGRAESDVTLSPEFTSATVTLPKPAAPTLSNYNTTARTVKAAAPTGYAIADLVYKVNNGSPLAVPSSGTITLGSAAVAPGALVVYVFANSSRQQGDPATNEVGFDAVSTTPTNPTFNTRYTPGDNISTGTWSAAPDWVLWLSLPLSTNTDPNPATMLVFDTGGTQIGQFDYNGADSNTAGFAVANAAAPGNYTMNGTQYPGAIYYNGTMTDGSGTRTGALKLTNGNATLSA
jgi:hypothetical protein